MQKEPDREFLKQLFLAAAEEEFADVPEDSEMNYQFSPRFERRMNRLIRKRKLLARLKNLGRRAHLLRHGR